jgi:YidC/Oxa1 family membrane protein insertase
LPEISNPNLPSQGAGGGGGDMRSTTLFLLMIAVLVLGYQFFFKPADQQKQQPQQQNAAQQVQQIAQPNSPAQLTATAPVQTVPAVGSALETQTTVENGLYKIVFTNRGGQVKQWLLKNYHDSSCKALDQSKCPPLDLVQHQVAEHVGLPLSLYTYEPALTAQLNGALYQVKVNGADPTTSSSIAAPASIQFHYSAGGVDVVKTFRFDKSYVIGIDTAVTRNGAPVRALVAWPGGLGDMEEFLPYGDANPASKTRSPVPTSAQSQFIWSLNGKSGATGPTAGGFLFWTSQGVSNNATLTEPYSWAAIGDLYFAAAFMPDQPEQTTLVTLHNTVDIPASLSEPGADKRPAQIIGLAVGDTTGATHLRLFAGPKATDLLNSIHSTGNTGKQDGPSLEKLIQLGTWAFIAKPLYLALRFLYEHGIGNWGWAIIIVTVIFNFALLPTRVMMMKSSLKMMRLQPKLDAIKHRYANLKANDPKRMEMQQEQMALMKTEGVNMYGSCLPMLLQMPLFFAYYRVLANAVELRQAHWFWLSDLSMPDATHVLPILIIGTMFLTQYITPSPGMDPAQRRMMAFMLPVVMGFTLWHFASGLALYWGTGNIINLGLQLAINQSSIGREMHEIAARRAAKKLGGHKTIQGRR